MTGTWASDWATGDVVTAAEFRKSIGCVADSTLGASAASFDFTGLPTTYAHLLIIAYLRGDTAAVLTPALLRLNNDSAANYDDQRTAGSAAAASAAEHLGQTSMYFGDATAASGGANLFSAHRFYIPHYAGSANNKTLVGEVTSKYGTSSGQLLMENVGGFWRSNSAVNRITISPTAGNWVAGSRVSIYVMGS